MAILYIFIIIVLIAVLVVLYLKIQKYKKDALDEYEKELIHFVIDMYLSYGDTLDIFPSEDGKNILIGRIENLKMKINGGVKKEDKLHKQIINKHEKT